VFNSELVTINTTEGAAYGAALLAGVGAGIWPDVDSACNVGIQITGSTTPQAETVAQYEPLYTMYRDLYPTLKEMSHKLSNLAA
jgi:xylulokinase